MKLAQLLDPQRNNLDLFRLIAAALVIYGHAYALSPQAGHTDFLHQLLGFDYTGSFAVKIFFFISGLVVGNSLLSKQVVVEFLLARFFRIMPALAFVVIVSALVIGPLFTNESWGAYLRAPQTWAYIGDNLKFQTNYNLPGLFADNPYKSAVNGSLWTLPYEVGAYLFLLACFTLGLFRRPSLAIALLALIWLDAYSGNAYLFTWRPVNHEIDLLAPCFATGVAMALYKDHIDINWQGVLGLLLVAFFWARSPRYEIVFYALSFYSLLYLSSHPWVLRLKPRHDLSYGVYLWGFPIQQSLAHLLPAQGVVFHQVSAFVLCLLLAWVSWTWVEAPGMRMGKAWIRRWHSLRAL